jgi:hypothetical protein
MVEDDESQLGFLPSNFHPIESAKNVYETR